MSEWQEATKFGKDICEKSAWIFIHVLLGIVVFVTFPIWVPIWALYGLGEVAIAAWYCCQIGDDQ